MNTSRSFLLFVLAALANAQSAPDFPVQVTTNLRVDFQSSFTIVDPAGMLMSRNDILNEPTVNGPKDASQTLDFMIFMIDQDAASPDNSNERVQYLQWYQPNLAGASEVLFDFGSDAQNFTSAPAASYVPPTPPAGDKAHRYTLLLYSQPKDFSIPSSFGSFFGSSDLNARLGFDMAGFADAAGIGQPVGANWFQVQNDSQPPTSSSSTTASPSTSSTTSSSSTDTSTSTTTITTTSSSSSTDSSTDSSSSTPAPTTMTVATVTADSSSFFVQTSTGPSTITTVTTAGIPTLTDSPSPSAQQSTSASASVSLGIGSGAGTIDARDSIRGLVVGLVLGVASAGLPWLL